MYCPVFIMSPALSFEMKRKQRSNEHFVSSTILYSNQVRVYHERVYANNVVSKFWLVRSFFSQHYSKFITNITSENLSQIRTKECKSRYFIYNVNLNFLCSLRHLNCDTVFAVTVSFSNESVNGFNNVRNRTVKTRFQIVKLRRLWKFLVKKQKFSLCNILVH